MEEMKNIEFNDKLQKEKYATITYSGNLFKENSASCYIVYGYGDSWEHTTEQEMIKNENGFTVDLKILNYDKLNFCFRNEVYNWDNNNSQNYSSPINNPEATPSFILNEDILVNILSSIYERDISKIENTKIKEFTVEEERVVPIALEESIGSVEIENSLAEDLNKVLIDIYENSVSEENQVEGTTDTDYNMSNVIDEVLSPLIENVEINNEQNINDVSSPIMDRVSDEFFKEFIDNIENFEDIKDSSEKELNTVVNDVVDSISKQDVNNITSDLGEEEEINKQAVELVNTVLDQVINSVEIKGENVKEQNALMVTDENKFVVSARQLSSFYIFRKRIRLALYKVFYAIPRMLKSFYGEDASNK